MASEMSWQKADILIFLHAMAIFLHFPKVNYLSPLDAMARLHRGGALAFCIRHATLVYGHRVCAYSTCFHRPRLKFRHVHPNLISEVDPIYYCVTFKRLCLAKDDPD